MKKNWSRLICLLIIMALVVIVLPLMVEIDDVIKFLQPSSFWSWVICVLLLGTSIIAWICAEKILSLIFTVLFIFSTVLFLPLLISHIHPYTAPSAMNELGDIYGSLNTLFSGLAFTAIIITILLQQKQINQQQNEMAQAAKQQLIERCFKLIDWNRESLSNADKDSDQSNALINGAECVENIICILDSPSFLNDVTPLCYAVTELKYYMESCCQLTAIFAATLTQINELSEKELHFVRSAFLSLFKGDRLDFILTTCIYSGMDIEELDKSFSYRNHLGLENKPHLEKLFLALINHIKSDSEITHEAIANVLIKAS